MDFKIESRLQTLSRSIKFWCAFALSIFTLAFFAIYWTVNNVYWQYNGYGFVVWIVWAGCILFAWINTATIKLTLLRSRDYIALDTVSTFHIGEFTPAVLKQCIANVANKAGLATASFTAAVSTDRTPNAFAAGSGSGKIVVVHQGILEIMTPAELEAVLGHEFGHVKNNDIFFLMFTTSAIMALVFLGRWIMNLAIYTPSSSKKDREGKVESSGSGCASPFFWIGLGIMLFGYIFAPLISAFISRLREDLADAFSTAIGYGPELQSAFRKLARYKGTTVVKNPALRALYLNAPKENWFEQLFASHPPLTKRIANIQHIMTGKKGSIPDWATDLLGALFTWFVLPAIGAGVLVVTGVGKSLPNFLDVPYSYLLAIAWWAGLNILMGSNSPSVGTTSKPNLLFILAGALLLAGIWFAGYGAIHYAGLMPVFVPYASLIVLFGYVWIAKPVVAIFGYWFGFVGVINDLINFTSVVFAALIIALHFLPLI